MWPASPGPCRGTIPATVTCQLFPGPDRAIGSFHFFAQGVSPGQPQSVLWFRQTSFDLPVTSFRLVDTLRHAGS